MGGSTAYQYAESLVYRLHELDISGKNDSIEANKLRDKSLEVWCELSDKEKTDLQRLSIILFEADKFMQENRELMESLAEHD